MKFRHVSEILSEVYWYSLQCDIFHNEGEKGNSCFGFFIVSECKIFLCKIDANKNKVKDDACS